MIWERGQSEAVVAIPCDDCPQRLGFERKLVPGDAADQPVCRLRRRHGLEPQAGCGTERRLQVRGPESPFEHVLARGPVGERLREETLEKENLDSALGQGVGEGVVLLAGPLYPEDVVEEQVVLVPRSQTPELEVGTVEDDPPKRPDLRAHVQARGLFRASGHVRPPLSAAR